MIRRPLTCSARSHQCDPMSPTAADAAPPLLGLEPPGIVGLFEQPVLQIAPVQKVRRSDVAARNPATGLLDERVARGS